MSHHTLIFTWVYGRLLFAGRSTIQSDGGGTVLTHVPNTSMTQSTEGPTAILLGSNICHLLFDFFLRRVTFLWDSQESGIPGHL